MTRSNEGAADGDAAERNDWRIGSPVGPIPPGQAKWIVDFSLTTSGNSTIARKVVETDGNGGRDSDDANESFRLVGNQLTIRRSLSDIKRIPYELLRD